MKGTVVNGMRLGLLIVCMPLCLKAQVVTPANIAAQLHYGFLIAHRPSMAHMQEEHSKGLELSFTLNTSGNKPWQRLYGFPEIGVSYIVLSTGSKEHLGNAHALYPFINFGIIKNKNYKLCWRLGYGFGYIEKTFSEKDNYKNNAIGSHLNAGVNVRIKQDITLSRNCFLTTDVGISHWSNGSVRTPNLGINIATASVGFRYQFGKFVLDTITRPYSQNKKGISILIGGFPKEVYPAGNRRFFAATLNTSYEFGKKLKHKWAVGADYMYDNSLAYRLTNSQPELGMMEANSRIGIHAAYIQRFDKMEIWLQQGYYLYNKMEEDSKNLFQIYGLRYYVYQKWFAAVNLKTHFAKADYIELGIGKKIEW
ncbi:MAG: acyloxyacyl hydrolase [Bacteroidetes bacterium]|nr:acyloxyacyl hydrolase [Bacteroidota bacterium]